MKRRILWSGSVGALALVAGIAPAAWGQSTYVTGGGPFVAPGVGGFYGGGYHTSTAAEGFLRGHAAVIEARGIASLYYARALGEREVARGQHIDNRRSYLHFWDEYQQGLADRRLEQRDESMRRLQLRQQMAAKENAQTDAAAGGVEIDWPAALAKPRYEPIKKEIEALANVRLELGDDAGESSELALHHAIRELARQIMADEDAHRMTEDQSQVVRPFVRGLAANILRATSTDPATQSIAAIDATQR